VYSTLGITRQRDGMTYQDVDYRGNLNLLRQAEDAGVDRFVYVSVLHGQELRRDVQLAEAKERFVDALTTSSMSSVVVRPTGYFSDMNAFLDMARRGTVYLFGDGQCRMNPISGFDLARACVEAAGATTSEIAVGGPEILTHDEIARAAFAALGTAPRIRHVPVRLARTAGWVAARLTPQRVFGPLQFVLAVMTNDMVAPAIGTDRLAAHFEAAVADGDSRAR
jgi:nucleoside-diphosphate-sugar epimerase